MKITLLCTDPKRGGRVAAGHIEDNNFIRKVKPSKHLIRKYKAFGIQEEVAQSLVTLKAIYFVAPEKAWGISVEDFFKYSFTEDLGHGLQRIIQLKFMTLVGTAQIDFAKANKMREEKKELQFP